MQLNYIKLIVCSLFTIPIFSMQPSLRQLALNTMREKGEFEDCSVPLHLLNALEAQDRPYDLVEAAIVKDLKSQQPDQLFPNAAVIFNEMFSCKQGIDKAQGDSTKIQKVIKAGWKALKTNPKLKEFKWDDSEQNGLKQKLFAELCPFARVYLAKKFIGFWFSFYDEKIEESTHALIADVHDLLKDHNGSMEVIKYYHIKSKEVGQLETFIGKLGNWEDLHCRFDLLNDQLLKNVRSQALLEMISERLWAKYENCYEADDNCSVQDPIVGIIFKTMNSKLLKTMIEVHNSGVCSSCKDKKLDMNMVIQLDSYEIFGTYIHAAIYATKFNSLDGYMNPDILLDMVKLLVEFGANPHFEQAKSYDKHLHEVKTPLQFAQDVLDELNKMSDDKVLFTLDKKNVEKVIEYLGSLSKPEK